MADCTCWDTGASSCTGSCWVTCGENSSKEQCVTLGDGGGGCTCSGDCKDECKDHCDAACNSSCSDDEAMRLYNRLLNGLNKKIYAADMDYITEMLSYEAKSKRHNKTIEAINIDEKQKALKSQIEIIQKNLDTFGQTVKHTVKSKTKIKTELGNELITLTKAVATAQINSSKTGDK